MQTHLYQLTFAASVALVGVTAQANNLFVTPSGSGASCSVDEPCAQIQSAIDIAQTGDHIFIGPGTYKENLTINADKTDLHLSGTGSDQVFVVSAGGDNPLKQTPDGNQLDIVADISASGVIVEKMSLIHPPGETKKRDIGVFIRPGAHGVVLQKTHIERQRNAGLLEPTDPGSRGVLVLRAPGTHIVKNEIGGNYQDHIHLPTNNTVVVNNTIANATRLGIVVIQETVDSDNSNNKIAHNLITDSASDGIQIEGDHNFINNNEIRNSGGAAINLCGPSSGCARPGDGASADNNSVNNNSLDGNAADIVDGGFGNTVNP